MLKESEILEKGLRTVKECLSVVPSLRIESIDTLSGKAGPDYRVTIHGESLDQIIYIEAKALGTPKSTREAVNSLLLFLQKEPSNYGVLVAPYISPRSASICNEAGIGYVDLSGNCYIAFQQVFINREKMANRFPFKTGLSSLYSPKSERVLRVLLTYPYRSWKSVELAKEAQVSLGMITHVSKKLGEEEWLKRTSEGIYLTQPEKLLMDWSSNYSLQQSTLFNFYSLKSLLDIETEISETCVKTNIPYALTGFSASNRLAPMVRGQRVMVYIDRDISHVADQAGLQSVDSGANVILIQPYDSGVLWKSQLFDGFQIANPIQVFLDLKSLPGRGEEAAAFLFKEVISTTWQQQSKITIIS